MPEPESAHADICMLVPVGPVTVAIAINWDDDVKDSPLMVLTNDCDFGLVPKDLMKEEICCT